MLLSQWRVARTPARGLADRCAWIIRSPNVLFFVLFSCVVYLIYFFCVCEWVTDCNRHSIYFCLFLFIFILFDFVIWFIIFYLLWKGFCWRMCVCKCMCRSVPVCACVWVGGCRCVQVCAGVGSLALGNWEIGFCFCLCVILRCLYMFSRWFGSCWFVFCSLWMFLAG